MKLPQQYLLDKISGMFGSLILKYALVIQHTISQDVMISRINFWLADTDGFI